MTIKTFEDVIAWQKGKELYVGLASDLRRGTSYFYRDQLLRATLSITNNIAEGFDRASKKELKQFLVIARGSAAETRSMLLLGRDLQILSPAKQEQYLSLVKDISKLLTGFIKSLQITDNRQQATKR